MQEVGKMDIEMRAQGFFRIVLKQNPALFPPSSVVATYETCYTTMMAEAIPLPPEKYKGYRLPKHLLDIHTGYFIEMVNADANLETFEGLDVLAACFYRKDWSEDYNEKELEDSSEYFQKKDLTLARWAWHLFDELCQTLRDTYPLLYQNEKDSKEVEEGRKLYDMLNALSQDNPNEWRRTKNLPLSTSFAYLEEKKKDYLKQKMNKN